MSDRISQAIVMAHGLATVYRRYGSGRTVVLLGAPDAVALALSASFLVIVPEVPLEVSHVTMAVWLGGIYDGLGIVAATIVTTPALAEAAARLREDAPERVQDVIIYDHAAPDAAGLREAVERSFG